MSPLPADLETPSRNEPGVARPRPAARHPGRAVARRHRAGALLVLAGVLCAVLVGRLHELVAQLQFLPVGKILLPMGLLLLISRPDLGARLSSFRTPQGIAFIVFVIMMALSVPTSMVQGQSLADLLLFLYGPVPFVVIVACAPRNADDIAFLMKALVVALMLLGLSMLSLAGQGQSGRVASSTTYDPNDVAHIAVTCVPFAVFFLRERSRLWRAIALGALLLLMAIVILSASRGGTIALVTVLAALLLARSQLKLRWKAGLIALVCVALSAAPSVFWERLATLGDMSSDYNLNSDSGRLEIWKRGVKVLAQRPLTGVGLGQFATADGTFASREGSGDKSWHTAHNAPLQVAVEIGVVGVVAFFWLFIPTLQAARRARKLANAGAVDPKLARLGDTLRISLLGFAIGALFLSAGFSIIAMTLAAIGMAYSRLLRGAAPAGQGRKARRRPTPSTAPRAVRWNGAPAHST